MTPFPDAADLRRRMAGPVIAPGDPDYDNARAVYNAMIDRRPALIARCGSTADVETALELARTSEVPVAVRGGGHSGPGFGTVDGGVVIDLSPMNRVEVDAAAGTARVQGGATLRDLDLAGQEHGLATPAGVISTTGIGGLTLGGGHGYLSRKYGLTIDNLLEARVVLANGAEVTASEKEHPDLFWALRGGGGNFGIVTSFTLRMHPVSTVVGGPTAWPLARAGEVMRWYRDFMPAAADDLYGFLAFMTVPPAEMFPEPFHMHKACAIVWCYLGERERADEVFAPVRAMKPAFDGLGELPYAALQSVFDALLPPGLQWYWRGDFVKEIPDAAVEEHLRFAERLPSMLSLMHLYPIDGAVHRVAPEETAWAFRDVNWSQVITGVDPDPGKAEELKRWAVAYSDAIRPHAAGAGYVNFMMDEGGESVRASYRANYRRLREIKGKYDPKNLFRMNQNIVPGAS